jgi:anti-sigma B factor antagonist
MTTVSYANKSHTGGNRITFRPRPVSIHQLPDRIDRKLEHSLLHDLECDLNVVRPAIVIDCSNLAEMNLAAIHLLLRCLEEAMKRNGDIRLSGVSPQARLHLKRNGIDYLFRIFPNIGEAVESFHRRSHVVTSPISLSERVAQEHAA